MTPENPVGLREALENDSRESLLHRIELLTMDLEAERDRLRTALAATENPAGLREGLIVGVVATALHERKVGLDTERHVLSELRAALAVTEPGLDEPHETTCGLCGERVYHAAHLRQESGR